MRITDAILLAAGSSRRMGRPKQLLTIGNSTLLTRTVQIIRSCPEIRKLYVALGANADLLKSSLETEQVKIVIAETWQNGMGASLKSGLNAIQQKKPLPDQILITVCDQPHLNNKILNDLILSGMQGKIIVSDYGYDIGTPALFDSYFYNQLISIPDDSGARKLFLTNNNSIIKVSFPEGAVDLDTPEDYAKFLKTEKE